MIEIFLDAPMELKSYLGLYFFILKELTEHSGMLKQNNMDN